MEAADNHLLDRAICGERDAMAELLRRHGPAARQSLAGKIPRRWRSVLSEDDIMQQTYVDAVLGIGEFNSRCEDSFAGWLARIALNNLRDALKTLQAGIHGGDRHRAEPGAGEEYLAFLGRLLADTGGSPSHISCRDEAIAALMRAVPQLSEPQACAVIMCDLEGLPADDAAHVLNRSPGAVHMLRHRGRQRLHEIMGNTSRFFSK